MDSDGYFKWLLNSKGLKRATCLSRVSNCATVEKHEGDLDAFYEQDRLAGLLDRLTYTTDDERHDASPKHSVPTKGNLRRSTATMKSAVTLYRDFRDSQHLDVLLASNSADDAAKYQRHILGGMEFMHRFATQLEVLHSDPLFALVIAEVDRRCAGDGDDAVSKAVCEVFGRCKPERRFHELKQIVASVVDSGYREATAYVSVYAAMKILDLARS